MTIILKNGTRLEGCIRVSPSHIRANPSNHHFLRLDWPVKQKSDRNAGIVGHVTIGEIKEIIP